MKTSSLSRLVQVLPLVLSAAALTSCKLPPNEAMRVIQSKGLFAYWGGDYSAIQPASYSSVPLLTAQAQSAQDLQQKPYATPRSVHSVPYRSTYHTNRNLRADYTRTPYRARTASVAEPIQRSPGSEAPAPLLTDGITPAPTPVAAASSTASKEAAAISAPAPASKPAMELPYGSAVSGRPGMVTSPYAQSHQLVDVTGLAPGDTVKDPYTGKLFRVPPSQQAAAKVTEQTKTPVAEARP
jgi:hypothetical protein